MAAWCRLILTKVNTDTIVKSLIDQYNSLLPEFSVWTLEVSRRACCFSISNSVVFAQEYGFLANMTITSGFNVWTLTLNEAGPANNRVNGAYLANLAKLDDTLAGVQFGFKNGDFVSALYQCRYTGCAKKDTLYTRVRSSETDGSLYYYNVVIDTSGYSFQRNESQVTASAPPIDYGNRCLQLIPSCSQNSTQ